MPDNSRHRVTWENVQQAGIGDRPRVATRLPTGHDTQVRRARPRCRQTRTSTQPGEPPPPCPAARADLPSWGRFVLPRSVDAPSWEGDERSPMGPTHRSTT